MAVATVSAWRLMQQSRAAGLSVRRPTFSLSKHLHRPTKTTRTDLIRETDVTLLFRKCHVAGSPPFARPRSIPRAHVDAREKQ